MNIVLLGYGKMGKLIGELALERGHQLVAKIDQTNLELRHT
ncbi:MAG: 4-hydroxy-tetrahydrodipicolinate reductase, partial [Bacteroidetes bacterium]|nr:4-hydroxy-tetrahydrodipicolinate reductase [Bacteroidota bacterium]